MWATLQSILGEGLSFSLAWLSSPFTLGLVLIVGLILFGLGRGLGLPRLFWHADWLSQLGAGASTAALLLEGNLVVYLLGAHREFPGARGAAQFSCMSILCWLALVGLASRGVSRSRLFEAQPLSAWRPSPAVRESTDEGPSFRRQVGVSPWPFVIGTAASFAILMGAAVLVMRVPAGSLARFLAQLVAHHSTTLDPRLHVVAFVGAIGFSTVFILQRQTASAAVALSCLLGLVIAVHGFLNFLLPVVGLEFVVLGLLLLLSGLRRYKLRLPSLASDYEPASLHAYPPHGSGAGSGLLPFDTPLISRLSPSAARPIVLVCTSGGGIRAATWTGAILGKLDALPGFRQALCFVSGASGGMVGAAHWLACAARGVKLSPEALAEGIARDSLTAVVRTLAFHDLPLAFLPFPNSRDRGQELEAAWCKHVSELGGDLRTPLSNFKSEEAAGLWPSLVFSPMLVEDGRRLLLSNVDLSRVTDHFVEWLSTKAVLDSPSPGLTSRSAYSFAELVPNGLSRLSLATAARLVASFPYVSPAVSLPTTPRRRVVDAGYFDNYGLELACGWLRVLLQERRSILAERCSGILVIQIRDNVSELSVNPETPDEVEELRKNASERDTAAVRGLEGLTTPAEAVLAARRSVTLFRNDAQLELVATLCREEFRRDDFLTTTVFEFAGEASLSWHLTSEEVQALVQQADSRGIKSKLDAIRAWL